MQEKVNYGPDYDDDDSDVEYPQPTRVYERVFYQNPDEPVDEYREPLQEVLEHSVESPTEHSADFDRDDTRFGKHGRVRRAMKGLPWAPPDTRGLPAPSFVPLSSLPIKSYRPIYGDPVYRDWN